MTEKSKIIEATVYPDRALVTRQLEIAVSSETGEIVFENLPSGIYRDSIRVSGRGDASVRIEGIDTRDEFLETVPDEEVQALEENLEKLQDELNSISVKLDLCEQERGFITGLQEVSSARVTGEYYFKKTTPEELQGMVRFFKARIEGINQRVAALTGEKKKLKKKRSQLKRDINRRSSLREKTVLNCYVSLEVKTAGKFSFYLSYIIDNAWWSPVYDVRLLIDEKENSEEKEIEIAYYGQVGQATGENWDDINIFLSTARPSVSASLPDLETWFVDFNYAGPAPGYGGASPQPLGGVMSAMDAGPIAPEESAAVDKGLTVTFGIKDSQDLPPDGTDKKVLIARRNFPVELDYRAFPRETEAVFIRGTFENNSDFPMLAGTVKVYHGQNYIGDSYLETVIPTEQARLSLGTDDSIKVKRELLKQFTQKKGVTGGYTRTVFRYVIKLENYKTDQVSLLLQEPVPLSRNKELKVELISITSKIEPNYQGVLNWELDLTAGEKRTFDVEYYVEYPRGRTIVGMDI
ncbi:MAG: mucoidy inhibitor MuiA family protein [bacterium]|nr:mucoidy inhibitor MuiA family protein [bacterium]